MPPKKPPRLYEGGGAEATQQVDWVGAERSSWAREETQPSEVHECRLREAHEAWQLLCMVEPPDTTHAWWMGVKDALDDLSPAEAMALDRGRDVLAAARAQIESS